MLNEKMFCSNEDDILNYSIENFEELLILIPRLKIEISSNKNELLKDLESSLYSSKALIDFDFTKWEIGVKIAENENFDLSSLEIIDLCKLLTSIMENSNYIQGGIYEYLEDGTILKILENIQSKFTKKG